MAIDCTPENLMAQAKCYTCLSSDQRDAIKTYLLAVVAGLDGNTPEQLLTLAKCYTCIPEKLQKAVQNYLLCQNANGGDGPAPVACANLEGSGDPTGSETPDFIGQTYRDTDTNNIYTSTGLTAADWSLTVQDSELRWTPVGVDLPEYYGLNVIDHESIPGVTSLEVLYGELLNNFAFVSANSLVSLSFPNATSITANGSLVVDSCPNLVSVSYASLVTSTQGITIDQCASLTSFSAPLLQSVDLTFGAFRCTALTSLQFPSLVSCYRFYAWDNTAMTSLSLPSLTTITNTGTLAFDVDGSNLSALSLPSLVTCAGYILAYNNPNLTTVSFPNFVPANTKHILFYGCALTDVSVNHILARCVANAAYVAGTVRTDGGTSAAPSGQGILDKATLIGRGCTVTTN